MTRVKSQISRKKQPRSVAVGISFSMDDAIRFRGGANLRVLIVMRSHADHRHETSLSLEQIATEISADKSTCWRAITRLIDKGIITRRRHGRNSVYRITDQYWHDDIEEVIP